MATCAVTSALARKPDWRSPSTPRLAGLALEHFGTTVRRKTRALYEAGKSPKASPVKSERARQKGENARIEIRRQEDCTARSDAESEAMMPRRVQ